MMVLTTSHRDSGYRNKTLDVHDGLFAHARDWRTVQNMYINCWISCLAYYITQAQTFLGQWQDYQGIHC